MFNVRSCYVINRKLIFALRHRVRFSIKSLACSAGVFLASERKVPWRNIKAEEGWGEIDILARGRRGNGKARKWSCEVPEKRIFVFLKAHENFGHEKIRHLSRKLYKYLLASEKLFRDSSL